MTTNKRSGVFIDAMLFAFLFSIILSGCGGGGDSSGSGVGETGSIPQSYSDLAAAPPPPPPPILLSTAQLSTPASSSVRPTLDTSRYLATASATSGNSSPCHQITGPSTMPKWQDWAPPYYNLSSSTSDVMIQVDCSSVGGPTVTAGSGTPFQYIYQYGYSRHNNQWVTMPFTGIDYVDVDYGDAGIHRWYIGVATASLAYTQSELDTYQYLAVWICTWNGFEWKCGCRDNQCLNNYWSLQVIKTIDLLFPVPGGTANTARVTAIFDHSGDNQVTNGEILTYMGESAIASEETCYYYIGIDQSGVCNSNLGDSNHYSTKAIVGYMLDAEGTAFDLPINYNDDDSSTPGGMKSIAWYDGHTGYDYGYGRNTEVRAAGNGTIEKSDCTTISCSSWGEIMVNHQNGYTTHYLHLSSAAQNFDTENTDNNRVIKGQIIGYVGDTAPEGTDVGVHLHFTVKRDAVRVDPYGRFERSATGEVIPHPGDHPVLWSTLCSQGCVEP